MGMLERGGNAFDAAVATGFTLQIVEPHLNGPGGDVPIILHPAGADEPIVICGQGVAPKAATIDAYRERDLQLVPGTGLLAAVVPGAFDAWMLLLRDYGTLTLRDVLEPAIGYALNGFPLVNRAAASIHAIADHFRQQWPGSAAVWLPGGDAPLANQIITTVPIGKTYQRILTEAEAVGGDRVKQIEIAREVFYTGFVADAIDRHCRLEFGDGAGRQDSGLLTGADLAGWRASYEKTVSIDYHGMQVHKTGPWGQGPVMLQTLALLKGFDLDALDFNGSQFVHIVTEALKLAFIDRDVFYGDPDFTDIPITTLLSPNYNSERRKLITDTASDALRPGTIGNAEERLSALLQLTGCEAHSVSGAGEPTFADVPEVEGDTVHLDVSDRWGNMVSATPSGGWLQSSPAIAGLGFNLTTRAQMFWLDERLPSAIAPGKRPRTTLTPTLVTRDNQPHLAFGSPGGDQQDQWSLIMFLRNIHRTQNLQAAIDAPMFHSKHVISSFYPRQYDPRTLLIENRYDPGVLKELTSRGHRLDVQDAWTLGRLCAVARGRTGVIRAAATPRFMQAYAVGR
jgi:gamma-glutamyltranspeptidase/glutathione hydrolase